MSEKASNLVITLIEKLFTKFHFYVITSAIFLSGIAIYVLFDVTDYLNASVISASFLICHFIISCLISQKIKGRKALKKLNKLNLEHKRIIRNLYNEPIKSSYLSITDGTVNFLLKNGYIYTCHSILKRCYGEVAYSISISTWVMEYIDKNPDWLNSFAEGDSETYKKGKEFVADEVWQNTLKNIKI